MTQAAADTHRTLGPSDAVPDDFVVPFYLDDRKLRISVARVDDRLYAFDDLCPCEGAPCPLSGGLLSRTTLMCPCHGSRFDLASGAVLDGPSVKMLTTYRARAVDGAVRVRL